MTLLSAGIIFAIIIGMCMAYIVGRIGRGILLYQGYPVIQENKEMVLEHMKEKYGEEFVGLNAGGPTLDRSYDEYVIYPKRLGKESLVFVHGYYDEKRHYYLKDSYFGILIHDRYQEYVEKMIKELYPKCYVSVKTDQGRVCPERLNRNTEINEIFSAEERDALFDPIIYVAFPESEVGKVSVLNRAETISQRMYENNLVGSLYIAIIRDEKYEEYVNKKGEIYVREDYPNVGTDLEVTANKDYFIPLNSKFYEASDIGQYNYQSYGGTLVDEEDNWKLKIY